MCLDGTKCRQGSPDAPDATSWGAWVQDAQDAQDAESMLGESGRNTPVSDAGYLFADECSIQKRIEEFEVRQEMRKQECYKRILRPGIRLEKKKGILV